MASPIVASPQQYLVTFETAVVPSCASNCPREIKRDIHIRDSSDGHEYISELNNDMVDSLRNSKGHLFFTADRAEDLIARIIERGDYKIERIDDMTLAIIFEVRTNVVGCDVCDMLLVRCVAVPQTDYERRIVLLEREVLELRAALRASNDLSRDVAIRAAISDAEHIFGPIPWMQLDFARKIFAAELDGKPYIFPVAKVCYSSYNIPPWVRSVIRYVDVFDICPRTIERYKCNRIIFEFDERKRTNEDHYLIHRTCGRMPYFNVGEMHHKVSLRVHNCIREIVLSFHPDTNITRTFQYQETTGDQPNGRQTNILWRMREFLSTKKIRIIIDKRYLLEKTGPFANVEVEDLNGRDLTSFHVDDTLRAELVEAEKSTRGIEIPQ